jgi:hypothetical protein
MGIDEEDDLDYVNETYYKIIPIEKPVKPRPAFFKY